MWLTAAWFVLTYIGLALGNLPGLWMDRAGIALVGATLMMVCGAISFDEAARAVDYGTIALLFGMMVVVAFLRLAGFFGRLARFALSRVQHAARPAGGDDRSIAVRCRRFLVNDIVCLALTPLVIQLARRLRTRSAAAPDRPGDGGEYRLDRHDHGQSAEHDHRQSVAHRLLAIRRSAWRRSRSSGWRST